MQADMQYPQALYDDIGREPSQWDATSSLLVAPWSSNNSPTSAHLSPHRPPHAVLLTAPAPTTAADLPNELHDTILSYIRHGCHFTKCEQGMIALVSRRWAYLIRPKIFERISLRSRDDVPTLVNLLGRPGTCIPNLVEHINLRLSVAAYPYQPWIHTVISSVLPRLHTQPRITLRIEGPLPPGKFMTSIHGVLPQGYPRFASGIKLLRLSNVHFKRFHHLVRLLKYMPALTWVDCEKLTWDREPDAQRILATSYLSRRISDRIEYRMHNCTDNRAVGWLCSLLGHTRQDILEQSHADALCSIASAFTIDPVFNWSDREGDKLSFQTQPVPYRGVPSMHAYLTPRERAQRRRIRAIVIDHIRQPSKVCDWAAIDKHIATLGALESVLISFKDGSDLLRFRKQIFIPKMPRLRKFPNLAWAISTQDRENNFTTMRVSCTGNKVRQIGELVVRADRDSWEQFM